MNDQKQKRNPAVLPVILAFLAGAIGLYLYTLGEHPPGGRVLTPVSETGAASADPMAAFLSSADRPMVANLSFKNARGESLSLANWKGRVVLVNLWATWCGPCRKEMPDLSQLQKELGSADFEVVAVSVDRKGLAASQAFLAETGAGSLGLYVDETTKTLDDLKGIGLPLSILIDRKGREIGRLLGPAPWNSPEAKKIIGAAIAEAS